MTRLVSSHLHFHVEATIWGRYAFGSVSRARKYHQRLQRELARAGESRQLLRIELARTKTCHQLLQIEKCARGHLQSEESAREDIASAPSEQTYAGENISSTPSEGKNTRM